LNVRGFLEANYSMQKALDAQKGDGKRQGQILEEIPDGSVLKKNIWELENKIATLKNQQTDNALVSYQPRGSNNEYSRGNPQLTGKL
jgi:hypothetical protein